MPKTDMYPPVWDLDEPATDRVSIRLPLAYTVRFGVEPPLGHSGRQSMGERSSCELTLVNHMCRPDAQNTGYTGGLTTGSRLPEENVSRLAWS